MKILTAALIFFIVIAAIFWGLSYYFVRLARDTTSLETTSTANFGAVTPLQKAGLPTTTPSYPHGPTTAPHMIGPSGPPPNY